MEAVHSASSISTSQMVKRHRNINGLALPTTTMPPGALNSQFSPYPDTRPISAPTTPAHQPQPRGTTQLASPDLMTPRFVSLAGRAYQDAVKFPDRPPPASWSPGDPLDTYYEAHIYKFMDEFRATVERCGNALPTDDPRAFGIECLTHARSILAHVRAEWDLHPLGSMGGWWSSADTPNRAAAAVALQRVVEKPTAPPPKGWKVAVRPGTGPAGGGGGGGGGDGGGAMSVEDLHVYYQIMLARFEMHMERNLREHGARLGMSREEMLQATGAYMEFIVKENRQTWTEMFT